MSDHYDSDTVTNVKYIYIIAIVLWIFLIYILELYNTDNIGMLILFIPILVYLISMTYFEGCDTNIENEVFQYDVFVFGVAVITLIISSRYTYYSSFFYKLLFVGVLLTALSTIDFWISKHNLILVKHIRSILQTAAVIIFIYIFYSVYFVSTKNNPFSHANPFVN